MASRIQTYANLLMMGVIAVALCTMLLGEIRTPNAAASTESLQIQPATAEVTPPALP